MIRVQTAYDVRVTTWVLQRSPDPEIDWLRAQTKAGSERRVTGDPEAYWSLPCTGKAEDIVTLCLRDIRPCYYLDQKLSCAQDESCVCVSNACCKLPKSARIACV